MISLGVTVLLNWLSRGFSSHINLAPQGGTRVLICISHDINLTWRSWTRLKRDEHYIQRESADDNLCDTAFNLAHNTASHLTGGKKKSLWASAMNTQQQEIFKMQRRERFPSLPSSAYCASHFQFAVIIGSDNHLALKADCISCAQVECVMHSSAMMKSASK